MSALFDDLLRMTPSTITPRFHPIDPGGDPEPPDPDPGPPPGPAVSFPDFMAQMSPCLSDLLAQIKALLEQILKNLPPDSPQAAQIQAEIDALDEAKIRALLDRLLRGIGPHVDIRPPQVNPDDPDTPPPGHCVGGIETLGIWLSEPSAPGTNDDGPARDRSLENNHILQKASGPTFGLDGSVSFAAGLRINHRTIESLAGAKFRALPKLFDIENQNGVPTIVRNDNGPYRLDGMGILFQEPNTIRTSIFGAYQTVFGTIRFTIVMTDTLGKDGTCHTETRVNLNQSDITRLGISAFFLSIILTLLTPLGIALPAAIFGALVVASVFGDGIATNQAQSLPFPSPGGFIAASLQPLRDGVLIPGGQKLVAHFSSVLVNSVGVTYRGNITIGPRSPAVTIQDFTDLRAAPGIVPVRFTALPRDLRSPQFLWSATNVFTDGISPLLNHNPQTIRFDMRDLEPGKSRTSVVNVTVTDADGLTATAQVSVKITALSPNPPPDHIPDDDGGGRKPDSPPIRD